jgi:hypothetical protein
MGDLAIAFYNLVAYKPPFVIYFTLERIPK